MSAMSDKPSTSRNTTQHDLHRSHNLAPPRIQFPSSSTSSLAPSTDYEQRISSSEREPFIKSKRARFAGDEDGPAGAGYAGDVERGGKPGLPKLSRECLWSEFKCYGKYIFSTLAVFGLLAIGISLAVYGSKVGWFDQ